MTDNMSREQRSRTMSRIRSRDTQVELALRRLLFARGLRFRLYANTLPGRPDIVFPGPKVAVFVDGDFWHGWRFERWAHKLAPKWKRKISGNRDRDAKSAAALRRAGWKVVRVWEHQIETDPEGCADRVERVVRSRRDRRG